MPEKTADVENDIRLKIQQNSYHEDQYRVNIMRADTLDSTHIGAGTASGKEGILTQESAETIFKRLRDEYDFSDYEFTSEDEDTVRGFAAPDIETV